MSTHFPLLPFAFCLLPYEHPLPTFAFCLMPPCVKPKGVEHPLPAFAFCLMPFTFYLLPYAFCLLPPCVKPKGVEHPERQKGADGATHSLVPGKRGWPPMSCQPSSSSNRPR